MFRATTDVVSGLRGHRRTKRTDGLLAAAVCLGLTLSWCAAANAQSGSGASTAPSVVVAPIRSQQVGRSDQFIGRIQAIQSVNLRARVEGFLDKVAFTQGSFVKSGDLLYEIEKAPYQADVAQAQAEIAAANAKIAGAKANLKNAQTNLDRQLDLVKRGTVSQAVADDAQAQRDLAAADVQSGEAQLKQAEAQLQTAKLNLSYTTITSPISGRIGATNVTEGNLVNPQTGTLSTVVQIDPIRVAFSIPESLYVEFAESVGKSGPDQATSIFEPTLQLPTGKPYGQTGKVAFASNEIDQSTGTLVIYADFPNPQGALLPGSYVNVTVQESEMSELPVVPAPAVLQDRQGQYVFVVNSDDRAEQRRITTGSRVDNGFAVTAGLQEGETVIVSGVQKVKPGEVVQPTSQPSSAATTASGSIGSNSGQSADAPAADGGAPGASGSSASGSSGSGSSSAPASSGTASGSSAPSASAGTAPAPASGDTSTGAGTTPAADAPTSGTAAASSSSAGTTSTSGDPAGSGSSTDGASSSSDASTPSTADTANAGSAAASTPASN